MSWYELLVRRHSAVSCDRTTSSFCSSEKVWPDLFLFCNYCGFYILDSILRNLFGRDWDVENEWFLHFFAIDLHVPIAFFLCGGLILHFEIAFFVQNCKNNKNIVFLASFAVVFTCFANICICLFFFANFLVFFAIFPAFPKVVPGNCKFSKNCEKRQKNNANLHKFAKIAKILFLSSFAVVFALFCKYFANSFNFFGKIFAKFLVLFAIFPAFQEVVPGNCKFANKNAKKCKNIVFFSSFAVAFACFANILHFFANSKCKMNLPYKKNANQRCKKHAKTI